VQSHCGTLASNTREESIHDEIPKFLLAARTFCTESYNKDIGSENRHTIRRRTECLQEHGTPYSSIINRSIPVLQDHTVEENDLRRSISISTRDHSRINSVFRSSRPGVICPLHS